MIKKLHNEIQNGRLTALELTRRYLDVIAEKEKDLNAFLTVCEEQALRQAEEVDEKVKRGEQIDLLAGIPFAVKDAICTRGTRTTAGSKILDNYIPPYNATVMDKLAAVDAVMLGKTNMDEFAMGASGENSAYGRTKNPLDGERVTGGSSSGSAAAVAAGEAVWALGSDTGGSIRQPAAFCGLVGLKPTYGRVSRYGLIAMASSLDQIGPLTSSVEDAAIVLSRIAGEDRRDATSAKSPGQIYEKHLLGDIRGKKIALLSPETYRDMDERIVNLITEAAEKLREAGAVLTEIELPHLKYALSTYYIIMPCEVSSNMARFDGIRYGLSIDDQRTNAPEAENRDDIFERYCDTRRYGLGEEVKRRIMLGTYALSAGYYDQYYNKAQKVRSLIRDDFRKVFEEEKVDAIFMPTAPEAAFKAGAKSNDPLTMYLSDIFTVAVNLAGLPALSLKVGTIKEDAVELPVGGQLIAEWFDEEGLLNIADVLEKSLSKKEE